MDETPRYRDAARQQLRDAIVDATRELTINAGWDAVRMGDVAARVGVSRQTVYNEFGNKSGLADALAQREVDRFLTGVGAALTAHGPDVRAGAYAAILRVLREASDNPLLKTILTSARGPADPLLPYLTTRSELVLRAATAVLRDWAAVAVPEASGESFTFAAETVVRLVVSHIVLPLAPVEQTAANLADLAAHLLNHARRPR
ncbi:TetR family transcriptional regulator [Micromonospora sp. NPDC049679]|uniref:TetR/AcrR family transcriptional regulator n=1 Tax=Micromonospora sp. NPDC049679 TaxID=3155920 RepID=UPI0033D45E9C